MTRPLPPPLREPVSPAFIEAEIQRLSKALDAITDQAAVLARESAEAEHAYRVAKAKALLASTGRSADLRIAEATVDTDALLLARNVAEALDRANTENGRNTRAQLDALRSLNVNARESAGLNDGRRR